jgi:very-short-patch-repair endonuclease
MEARLVRWIVGSGLPRPVLQHRVHVAGQTYRLDLAFPEMRIGIEYDGWTAHASRSSFDRDRARQNPLTLHGWLILRYTSASTRADVVAQVREALARRAPNM